MFLKLKTFSLKKKRRLFSPPHPDSETPLPNPLSHEACSDPLKALLNMLTEPANTEDKGRRVKWCSLGFKKAPLVK